MSTSPPQDPLRDKLADLGPEERRLLARLERCPRCARLLAELVPAEVAVEPAEAAVRAELEELLAAASREERLLSELQRVASPEPGSAGEPGRRPSVWKLVEDLLEASRRRSVEDGGEAERLVRLALRLTGKVDVGFYGERLLADLEVRVWTTLGAVRRVAGDLVGAGEAFAEAGRRLGRGTGDPLDRALLREERGRLAAALDRLGEAGHELDRAAALYRSVGDREAAVGLVLESADLAAHAGRPDLAISTLERALAPGGEGAGRSGTARLRHRLVGLLTETEELDAAERWLAAGGEGASADDAGLACERRWLEARLARGRGRVGEAEEALTEALAGFLEARRGFEASRVGLELAELYQEQRRPEALREVADATLPVFDLPDLHHEALRALAVFERRVRDGTATPELVRELGLYLDRSRDRPELVFEEPAEG